MHYSNTREKEFFSQYILSSLFLEHKEFFSKFYSFFSILQQIELRIIISYLPQPSCCLMMVHPHQISRGKQNYLQDYPKQPKFQDKIVQAKRIQVWDNAKVQPFPKFPYPACAQMLIKSIRKKKSGPFNFMMKKNLQTSKREEYLPKIPIQECKCHIEYIGANSPQENEDKEEPI